MIDTSQLTITQLQECQKNISYQDHRIQQLNHKNEQYLNQINHLNSLIHSFYTKGVPLQSALGKNVFDGSYHTLVQQSDDMRKQLSEIRNQLNLANMKKKQYQDELLDLRSRVIHYRNRINDLQQKLQRKFNGSPSYQFTNHIGVQQFPHAINNKSYIKPTQYQASNSSPVTFRSPFQQPLYLNQPSNSNFNAPFTPNYSNSNYLRVLPIYHSPQQSQLPLLHNRLNNLQSSTRSLELEQQYLLNKSKSTADLSVQISFLDDQERSPY